MNIKRSILLTAIFSLTAYAQEKGQWRAMSTTARNITGDVSISANKVTINFASFTIAQDIVQALGCEGHFLHVFSIDDDCGLCGFYGDGALIVRFRRFAVFDVQVIHVEAVFCFCNCDRDAGGEGWILVSFEVCSDPCADEVIVQCLKLS